MSSSAPPSNALAAVEPLLQANERSKTAVPDDQTADLAAHLRVLSAEDEQYETSLMLRRIRRARSSKTTTPGPSRPRSVAPHTEEKDDDDTEGHMLLKGDEEDEEILQKRRSRCNSVSSEGSVASDAGMMTDDDKLQAIIEEFGSAREVDGSEAKDERLVAAQGGVLIRRVLVRGHLVLTTHRLCFIAVLPTDPIRHRTLQQGAAIIHRPGLTRRKRRAWFTLTSNSITAYPSSTELYEPLGGARLVDIDDVQLSPHEKSIHFRVKGKKYSMQFETEEATLEWQREIDAALFLYTHHLDKIRICMPLVRIAQVAATPGLDFANIFNIDVLDADERQHRHPLLHRHAYDRGPSSTIDLVFAVLKETDHITGPLKKTLQPWTEQRIALESKNWHTLPHAQIEIDGPRVQTDVAEETPATPLDRQKLFITQFSLDCKPEEVHVFKVDLVRKLPLAGLFAVSPRYICFFRRHRFTGLADTRIRIPLYDIQGTSEGKAFLWHHHGLRIRIRAHEDMTLETRDRDVRDQILTLIKSSMAQEVKMDCEQVQSEQTRREEERSHPSKLEMLARQERHARVATSPAHINLIPRAVNMHRSQHLVVQPMKVHCLTIGSRGDVQPYVALCKRLQRDHHQCTIVSHPEYREWVENNGIAFREVGGDPGELMKLSVDNNKMLFSPQFYREAIGKFRHWLDELLRGIMETCWDADLIIESPSTFGGIHVAEAVGCYYMRAFTMPWTKTSDYPQAFSVPSTDLGPQYNAMSYAMFDQVLWLASSGQVNRWRKNMLHLGATDLAKLDQASVPFMYNFSPAVVPPPLDWGDRIKVTGYWQLTGDATKWEAPADLMAFIEKARTDKKRLCYIGFGSITMQDPIGVQRNIYEAVQRADVRAIVSKGWSARMLAKIENEEGKAMELKVPQEVYTVDSIPHDWLFPRIDVAMHHGGAGTTGASLGAGLVTLIHPFFGDQFFWSGRVAKLGAGLRVKSLQADDLADCLKKASGDRLLREKAEQVGDMIRRERGIEEATVFIYHNLSRAKRTKHEIPHANGAKSAHSLARNESSGGLHEEQSQSTLSKLWSTDSLRSHLPKDVLRKSSSFAARHARIGSGRSKDKTLTPSEEREESTVDAAADPAVTFGMDHVARTASPDALPDLTPTTELSLDEDEQVTPPEHRKTWYSHARSVPSMSMPHLNFLDFLHHTSRNHAEAAASAKGQMSNEEREHVQKEDKKRHISAKQEDQRRRQLLEQEWRKAKRFDLLDAQDRMSVQPEDEEDEEEEGDLTQQTSVAVDS
jgi:sterol 3beta-glucosyltransferase